MLYVINNKCYVNIAPSIYVEVVISKDGKITPTQNRIEANANTKVSQTTISEWLNKFIETEPTHTSYVVDRKHNKRKK